MERVLLSLQAREPDAEQFIRPQAKYADLVLSLQPIHHDMLTNTADALTPRLRLLVRSRIGFNEATFSRVLVGFCGLHVDMQTYVDTAEVAFMVEGDVSAQEIALSARMICPQMMDFLDIAPQWQDGLLGLMQIITLTHMNQALTRRFL
jgi:hypothetical protein